MPANWKRIAEQNELYTIRDFQKAAHCLMMEQVLYQANPRQRADYDLITAYEGAFTEAFDLFGCKLDLNTHERYVAAIPTITETSKITLTQTLLALVLRKLYDHHVNRGMLKMGVAGVSLPELETAFQESTGRDLPMKPQSELTDLLGAMKRWGIARLVKMDKIDEVSWFVEILPGIQSIIKEQSLAMLRAHAESLYEPDEVAAQKQEKPIS